jgi:hypothetical protein
MGLVSFNDEAEQVSVRRQRDGDGRCGGDPAQADAVDPLLSSRRAFFVFVSMAASRIP